MSIFNPSPLKKLYLSILQTTPMSFDEAEEILKKHRKKLKEKPEKKKKSKKNKNKKVPLAAYIKPDPINSPVDDGIEDAVIISPSVDEESVSQAELLEALFETAHSAKEAFECGWDTRWNPVTFSGFFEGIAAPKLKAGRLYKIFGPSPEEKRALSFLTTEGKPCVIAEVMPPGIGAAFELKELTENSELPSVSVERLKELLRKNCNIDYTEASV